jgi:hypothetical protein
MEVDGTIILFSRPTPYSRFAESSQIMEIIPAVKDMKPLEFPGKGAEDRNICGLATASEDIYRMNRNSCAVRFIIEGKKGKKLNASHVVRRLVFAMHRQMV